MATETQPQTKKDNAVFWGLFFIMVILYVIYKSLDDAMFAQLRPWNLFLVVTLLAASIGSMTCCVLVLVRMCGSEKDRALGIVSAVLLPVLGIGSFIAFVWGWSTVAQNDPVADRRRKSLCLTMQWWTGCIAAMVIVFGYVFWNAKPVTRMSDMPQTYNMPAADERYVPLPQSPEQRR